jgi:uncharacterized protein (TIGR02246 family)
MRECGNVEGLLRGAYHARMVRQTMRAPLLSLLLAATLAVPCRVGAQAPDDVAAVKALVARYVEAREARDGTALAALFTSDADQLVSSGEWRRGRDAVVRGGLASSAQNSGARTITIETVRLMSREVAIADGRYEIAGGADGPRRMWTTFVLVRTADGWRIAAIRNMRPTA